MRQQCSKALLPFSLLLIEGGVYNKLHEDEKEMTKSI